MRDGGEANTGADLWESGRPVVLQVLPALVSGGVERGTVEMARAIVAAGGTALVASSGGPMVRLIERAGGRHLTLPLASKNPFVLRRNAEALIRLIEAEGVDLVHARSRAPAWSALWATRRSGRPLVTTFHAPYGDSGFLKHRYNSVMAKGARVIAISHFLADIVHHDYAVPAERLHVIHRGVDLELFDPAAVSQERVIQLARRWRLPDGVPVVMLPARLSRWKGQSLLLQALARLRGEREFLCLLVGAEQRRGYAEELTREAAALGLGGQVYLAGACDDMPAAYMLGDVVVSPSLEPEGFGRTVAEGQAMGRPVVAAGHGGALEQVIDGETGFLVVPGDAEALAAGLRRALDLDGASRARLAARARGHIAEHFAVETMCLSTLRVYDEVLRAQARPPARTAGESAEDVRRSA